MNMARTTEPVTLTGTWDVLLSHTALLGAAMVVEEELGAGAVRLREWPAWHRLPTRPSARLRAPSRS